MSIVLTNQVEDNVVKNIMYDFVVVGGGNAKQKLCHRGEEDAQLNQSLSGAQLLRGDFVLLSHGGDLRKRKKIKVT
jgi:hypothetical protein